MIRIKYDNLYQVLQVRCPIPGFAILTTNMFHKKWKSGAKRNCVWRLKSVAAEQKYDGGGGGGLAWEAAKQPIIRAKHPCAKVSPLKPPLPSSAALGWSVDITFPALDKKIQICIRYCRSGAQYQDLQYWLPMCSIRNKKWKSNAKCTCVWRLKRRNDHVSCTWQENPDFYSICTILHLCVGNFLCHV